jgi:hypothetical protein
MLEAWHGGWLRKYGHCTGWQDSRKARLKKACFEEQKEEWLEQNRTGNDLSKSQREKNFQLDNDQTKYISTQRGIHHS